MSPKVLLNLLAVGLLGAGAAAQEPMYAFKLKKPKDSITARRDMDRAVFTITSESGIGGATLSVTASKWLPNASLYFQYGKDKGYRSLENLVVSTSRLKATGAVAKAGTHKLPFVFADADGKIPAGQPAAGFLEVLGVLHKDVLEVTLPVNLFAGSKEVTLEWIDAYRR